MAEALNLTPDQKAKIEDILRKHHDEMEKMRALQQTIESEVKEILTPEQQQKWAGMRGRGEGPGGRPQGLARMQEMIKDLNLTSDQQAKVQQILQENQPDMQDIRDDKSLSEQQRQDKMKALHQTIEDEIKSILTPEQQQKFAAQQEHHQDQKPVQ